MNSSPNNPRNSYEMRPMKGGGKDKTIQKLGASIVSSISRLKQLKTEILSSNDIMEMPRLFAQFQKENVQFQSLQDSLAVQDESTPGVQRIIGITHDFLEHYDPLEVQKKLNYLKGQRERHAETQMEDGGDQYGGKQMQKQKVNSLEIELLRQESQELKVIQKLISQIKQIALETSKMIMEHGQKLNIAAVSIKEARRKFTEAKGEIVQANEYQQNTNKKMIMFCLILTIVVVIIIMIMAASRK